MITLRPSQARGAAKRDWLDSRHSFSFGDYFDPAHMGFGPLRVINEDVIAPGGGFGTHGHHDMEIVTYVLEGALVHRDSLGNGSQIRPGDVQRMTAGTGIRHSEFNASADAPVHLLQIWILPEVRDLTPGYEEKVFGDAEKRNRLRLIASRDGRDGSVTIHQGASIFSSVLEEGATATHMLAPGRLGWVQVVRGDIALNGVQLAAGDGVAISEEDRLHFEGRKQESEFLLFDLPH